MINRHDAVITSLVIHRLGTKTLNTDLLYSKDCSDISDADIHFTLLKYFVDQYKLPEYFKFSYTNGDLVLNPVYNFISNIFDNPASLYEESIHIARLLQDKSNHHSIKGGDLFICHIDQLLIDDEMTSAVCILKSEDKEYYLNVSQKEKSFFPESREGINLNKIDKACLIINTNRSDGYKVLNIDHLNKSIQAKYWRDEFLYLTPMKNDYRDTKEFIKLTSDFIKKKYGNDESDFVQETDFLKRTFEYVKQNDTISEEGYKAKILKSPILIDAFDEFVEERLPNSTSRHEAPISVSELALKQHSRVFRSVIKLDKNFHVYVHGDHNKIMKGMDELGKKYYILYYDEET